MIIGNNNNFNKKLDNNNNFNNTLKENTSFNTKMNQINENNKLHTRKNILTESVNTMNQTDPTNRNEMRDKSVAMLNERLANGTLSFDEYNKKMRNINKNK